ncbi:MAG: ATP-binding cassette domain-containing protein [Nostocoides sp.]
MTDQPIQQDQVLQAEDVTVSIDPSGRGRQVTVAGATIHVARGEVVGLVGESGSGKTMLSRAIAGLLMPGLRTDVSGSVRLLGRELLGASAKVRREALRTDMSYVFQDPHAHLNPTMRIEEQVAEAVVGSRSVAELFESVGLPSDPAFLRSYPHQLSGGMKQRVIIAIALAKGPGLIIADEPTTALDVTIQEQVLSLVRRLAQDEHVGILLVSHDLAAIGTYCSRMYVMNDGHIVEGGSTQDILWQPQHPYTQRLMTSMRRLYGDEGLVTAGAETPTEPAGPHEARDRWSEGECELDDITVTFGGRGRMRRKVTAVDGVSVSIERGHVLGLVGESGSGKSTLGRVMVGLQQPGSGTVSIEAAAQAGRDFRPGFGGRVQMVFQSPAASLNPKLKIGRILSYAARRAGIPRAEVADQVVAAMREVGVEPPEVYLGRYPHELSGGQQQRIAIARALLYRPHYLVADEPTSALDASVRVQILSLLRTLQLRRGMGVLFITHDLSGMRALADRTAVMFHGELVEQGDVEQIFAEPQQEYTKRLLNSTPKLIPPK